MRQKTTWMRYLTLGTSIVALLSTISCKKNVDYFVTGTFAYINNTDSLIEVKGGTYDFKINPNESHSINQAGEGPKEVNEKSYVSPILSAVLIFNNSKCDTLDSGLNLRNGVGITGIENYTSEKVGERHYKFTYTFTEEDYNKAVLCE
jgi:hypothetical protein